MDWSRVQDQMADVANHLDLTVDYGWAWFIAKPLFKLLTLINLLYKTQRCGKLLVSL